MKRKTKKWKSTFEKAILVFEECALRKSNWIKVWGWCGWVSPPVALSELKGNGENESRHLIGEGTSNPLTQWALVVEGRSLGLLLNRPFCSEGKFIVLEEEMVPSLPGWTEVMVNIKGSIHVTEIAWRKQNTETLAKLHSVYISVPTRLVRTKSTVGVLANRFEVKVKTGSHIYLSDCPENGTSTL